MKKITKVVIIALLAIVAVSAKPELKWNGDAQFRLRHIEKLSFDSTGEKMDSLSSYAYYNKYAWNLKLAVNINDNFNMKFRLSNPNGIGLDDVSWNQKTYGQFDPTKNRFLAIPQAEMIFKAGNIFNLHAGILEVKGNTVLDLTAGAEIWGYKTISSSNDWASFYNNTQTGLKVGLDFSAFDINVMTAIAEKDGYKDSNGVAQDGIDFRFIVDAPISISEGKFKVTPSVMIRTGITGSAEADNKKTLVNGGADFTGKFTDFFTINVGVAYGQFHNADINTDESISDFSYPFGTLLTVKPVFKFSFNSISVGYSYGVNSDLNQSSSNREYNFTNHVDIKWGLAVNKNFTIMPRLRTWNYFDNDTSTGSTAQIRPELIFVGKF